MKTKLIFTLWIMVFISCGKLKKDTNGNENDILENKVKSEPYILLDSTYSIMKNKGKEVPYYTIPNLDSFVVDITGYNFVLWGPNFDYIRDGINYPEMIGGSFAYVDILYNDSLEVHPHKLAEPSTFVEIEADKKFAIRGIRNQFKGNLPTEFILAFRFYIDNAAGQQEIDQFKVRVAQ